MYVVLRIFDVLTWWHRQVRIWSVSVLRIILMGITYHQWNVNNCNNLSGEGDTMALASRVSEIWGASHGDDKFVMTFWVFEGEALAFVCNGNICSSTMTICRVHWASKDDYFAIFIVETNVVNWESRSEANQCFSMGLPMDLKICPCVLHNVWVNLWKCMDEIKHFFRKSFIYCIKLNETLWSPFEIPSTTSSTFR